MIAAAKQKLKNYPNIEFLEAAPTEKLIELKTQFDVVTAIQSHHYSQKPQHIEATQICFNLLTAKGVYVTFENIHPFTFEGTEIGKENWKRFQMQSGREAATVEAHMKRFGVEYFPITVGAYLALLREVGFSVVELLWFSIMQAGFYAIK